MEIESKHDRNIWKPSIIWVFMELLQLFSAISSVNLVEVDGVDPFEHFDGFKQWSDLPGENLPVRRAQEAPRSGDWNLLQWPCLVLSDNVGLKCGNATLSNDDPMQYTIH